MTVTQGQAHRGPIAVASTPPTAPVLPDLTRALQQAALLQRQSRFREAEGLYREILRTVPNNFDALHGLALIRLQVGDYPASIRLFRRALAIDPRSTAAYNNLGGAFQAINRHEDAVAPYRRALAIDPDFADAHNNLGAALKSLGRVEEARQAFERAVALAPGRPAFYRNLVDSRRVTAQDPWLPALERLADHLDTMPQESRIQLHFALAKAYGDLGQNERSFRHQLDGNTLKRRQTVYDEGNTLGLLARTGAVFDEALMAQHRGQGDPSSLPVFIVGMPRSGTSLVEQILASHPAIEGTMELGDMVFVARKAMGDGAFRFDAYPGALADLDAAALRARGVEYIARTRVYRRQGRPLFIDKMPNNFVHTGLIHLILPNAKIVDVRRHPLACCLSAYTQHFAQGQAFSYSLGDLGRYYADYVRLMAHMDAVLPGRVHRVHYEALVADPEGEVRRLLAYCGVPYDPACLGFHETRRAVRTASSEQVRRPIFRDGLARWRGFEPSLGPLKAALGPALDAYPLAAS